MLVLDLAQENKLAKVAVMADEVSDVIEISAQEIESVPRLGIGWSTECFRGVTTRGDQLIILVHIENSFVFN